MRTVTRLLPLLFLLAGVLPAQAQPAGPAAPAGLRVVALAPDHIDLDWLAPAQPVAGYRLYRDGAPIRDLPGDATRVSDTGLQPSTLHVYKLAALGEGAAEGPASAPAAEYTLPPAGSNPPRGTEYDVLVVGATPGGIGAALAAARMGMHVALVEPSRWIGGMMAGGLSNTDFRYQETHGGYFKEFTRGVLRYYQTVYGPDSAQVRTSMGGYKFEPHVARAILVRMVAGEPNISLFTQMRATGVAKQGRRVQSVSFENLAGGPASTLSGKVVIDATYEGDIAAFAGVPYRIGRESKGDYNEAHAGELFWNMDERKIVFGSGVGDRRIQAYNYRLCMTTRADNRVPAEKPEGYDRTPYLKIVADAKRMGPDGKTPYATVKRVLGLQGQLPNDKWDINNSGMYWPSTDLVGGNDDYPEASWARREAIIRAHRTYIQGLLYFIQNDPELPEAFRTEAQRWGLARDEFVDNGNWPTALYIREARRFRGRYWFTENDTHPRQGEERSPLQPEGVGCGDYSLDSHATQPPKPETPNLIEGFFYGAKTAPYQVPFGVMVPVEVDNLLMPVAVSATHIGLSTIRMEPTWMALGQAAGTAAAVSILQSVPTNHVPVPLVQQLMLTDRQVVVFLSDVDYDHPDFAGLEYGALVGIFPSYEAKPDEPLDRATAAQWLRQWMHSRWAPAPVSAAGLETAAAVRPTEPIGAADAARWIASAHRASDVDNYGRTPAYRAWLEGRILELLEGIVRDNPRMDPKALTRGQFLTLMYQAGRVQ